MYYIIIVRFQKTFYITRILYISTIAYILYAAHVTKRLTLILVTDWLADIIFLLKKIS